MEQFGEAEPGPDLIEIGAIDPMAQQATQGMTATVDPPCPVGPHHIAVVGQQFGTIQGLIDADRS